MNTENKYLSVVKVASIVKSRSINSMAILRVCVTVWHNRAN